MVRTPRNTDVIYGLPIANVRWETALALALFFLRQYTTKDERLFAKIERNTLALIVKRAPNAPKPVRFKTRTGFRRTSGAAPGPALTYQLRSS